MIPKHVRKQLPSANLIRVERLRSRTPSWARFRLANARRFHLGWWSVVIRAPWLDRSARQLHPHLFT